MTQSNSDYRSLSNLLSDSLAGVLILAGGQSTRMGQPKALMTLPTGETLLDYHVRAARQLAKPIFIADNQQGFQVSDLISHANTASHISYIQDYQPDCHLDKQAANNQETDNPGKNLPNQTKNVNQTKHSNSVGPLGAILAGLQQLDTVYSQVDDSQSIASKTTTSKHNKPSFVQNRWLLVVSCDSLVNANDIWQWVLAHTGNAESIKTPASVICLTDATNLYPLLGLYRLDSTDSLKAYLESGQRRVMRFIDPICQSVLMPEDWQDLSNLNTPSQFAKAVAIVQSL